MKGRMLTQPVVLQRTMSGPSITNLKLLCLERAGLYETAAAIGINGPTMCDYANGVRKVTRPHLLLMMAYFQMNAQDIIGWHDYILDDGELIDGGKPTSCRDLREYLDQLV